MNLTIARQILKAAEADPNGWLVVRGRKMRHEAELMRDAGWVELTKSKGARATMMAHLTEAGRRVSRLFRDDATAQRLLRAFMPHATSNLS